MKYIKKQTSTFYNNFKREISQIIKSDEYIRESVKHEPVDFDVLKGKTLTNVEVVHDKKFGDDSINFKADDGTEYSMYHSHDCSESVTIDDINGDIDDLIGTPILIAKMVTNSGSSIYRSTSDEGNTWTFYKLATIKGYVVFRWFGTSNGYYSEEVEFYQVK